MRVIGWMMVAAVLLSIPSTVAQHGHKRTDRLIKRAHEALRWGNGDSLCGATG